MCEQRASSKFLEIKNACSRNSPVKRAIVFFTLSLKHVSSGWKKSVRWAGMYYKYYYTHFFDIRRYLLGLEYLGEKKGHSDGEVNNRVTTWISAYIEKGVK